MWSFSRKKCRLLLVDDHALLREGLKGLFQGHPYLDIVGEAADGVQAIEVASAVHPDVVIMDCNMPKLGGIESTRRIKQGSPETVIIGLSMICDTASKRLWQEAGAAAVLDKAVSPEELCRVIARYCRQKPEVTEGIEFTRA